MLARAPDLTLKRYDIRRGVVRIPFRKLLLCVATWFFVLMVTLSPGVTSAQEQPPTSAAIEKLGNRLDDIADILSQKLKLREELSRLIAGADSENMTDEREKLIQINQDIISLRSTFELVALGDVDVEVTEDDQVVYDWRQELIEVVAPLLDSLKSLTKKPRQLSELRESVRLNNERLMAANKALSVLGELSATELDSVSTAQVLELKDKWRNEQQSFEQELLLAKSQLERLEFSDQSSLGSIWPTMRSFLLGRGLTLLLAVAAAALSWGLMRFFWWIYSTRFTTKTQRRGSLWFRLLEYSYYILTFTVVTMVVLAVLYAREDLLLLALALVLIAAAALSLRQFVPAYIKEARLLLNLGSVREDESVMYAGLPWQVMSLNIQTVLRNPALEGILRLPLESVSGLNSRPIKDDTLWFPTSCDDYIILPDDSFGHVLRQTPELVQVRVKGGMIQSWPTADFYSMSILNLSRGDSYGVGITFGFDYSLQSISLTDVPDALRTALQDAFAATDYEHGVKGLLVDLQSAGASSIDYLIYVTMDSALADKYYAVQRLVNRTCVSVANDRGWNIPFPQMMVHYQPVPT